MHNPDDLWAGEACLARFDVMLGSTYNPLHSFCVEFNKIALSGVKPMSRILALSLVLLAVLAGCRGLNIRVDDQYSYIDVNLTAPETASLIERLLTGGDRPLMRTARAELRQNEIVVTGDVNNQQGGTTPGNLRVQISAVNGQLQVNVRDLNFAGFVADQNALAKINSDIAAGLAQGAQNNTSGAQFTSLSLTPAGLSFTIRTPRSTPVPR